MATADDGGSNGIGAYVDHVDWQESAMYGGAAWVAGLIASYVLVTVSGVADEIQGDTLELAVTAYYHGMGGLLRIPEVESAFLELRGPSAMTAYYAVLESRFWGVAVWLHYVAPAVALVVAGYAVAGAYTDDETSFEGRLDAWIGGVSAGAVFGGLTLASVVVFQPDGFGLETPRLLLAVVVYPVALAGVGAARQVGFGVASLRGFVGGIAAVAASFGLWYVLEDSVFEALPDAIGGADRYLPMTGEFLAGHGVFVRTAVGGLDELPMAQRASAVESIPQLFGSVTPGLFAVGGPLLVGALLAYRAETTDVRRAAGQGARIAFGYLVAVFLLGAAVFGQYMSTYYDQIYGTGTTQEVREVLIGEANYVFGGLLPDVVLVAGLLWPVVFGAVGGVVGAKVVESQQDQPAETGQPATGEANVADGGGERQTE